MTASWGRLTMTGHMMDSGVPTPHDFGRDYRRRSLHVHDGSASLSPERCWKVDSARSTPIYRGSTPSTSFRLYNEQAKDFDYLTRPTWTRATPPVSKRNHTARPSPTRVQPTSLRGNVQYPAYTHDQLVNSARLRPEEQRELHSKLKSFRVRAIDHKGTNAAGSINDHPRAIPYSGKGAKQDSWTRTGRKTLEGRSCVCVDCQHHSQLTLSKQLSSTTFRESRTVPRTLSCGTIRSASFAYVPSSRLLTGMRRR
jgi:hypothetical protein